MKQKGMLLGAVGLGILLGMGIFLLSNYIEKQDRLREEQENQEEETIDYYFETFDTESGGMIVSVTNRVQIITRDCDDVRTSTEYDLLDENLEKVKKIAATLLANGKECKKTYNASKEINENYTWKLQYQMSEDGQTIVKKTLYDTGYYPEDWEEGLAKIWSICEEDKQIETEERAIKLQNIEFLKENTGLSRKSCNNICNMLEDNADIGTITYCSYEEKEKTFDVLTVTDEYSNTYEIGLANEAKKVKVVYYIYQCVEDEKVLLFGNVE